MLGFALQPGPVSRSGDPSLVQQGRYCVLRCLLHPRQRLCARLAVRLKNTKTPASARRTIGHGHGKPAQKGRAANPNRKVSHTFLEEIMNAQPKLPLGHSNTSSAFVFDPCDLIKGIISHLWCDAGQGQSEGSCMVALQLI